jgi:hypothetical protein
MISRRVTLPELGLISGTRAALGAGIGLLVAARLNGSQRRAVGWTLLAVGVLSTIPLFARVIMRGQEAEPTTSGAGDWMKARSRTAQPREGVLAGL